MTDAPDDPEARAARTARFVAGFMVHVPHVAALGITYVGHGEGWAELALPYAPGLILDAGIIASGAVFSLMDSAAGMAVMTRIDPLGPHATLDLRLDYLCGPEPGRTIVAHAKCYRTTRAVAFVRGYAHQGDPDRPIANMAGTFIHGAGA